PVCRCPAADELTRGRNEALPVPKLLSEEVLPLPQNPAAISSPPQYSKIIKRFTQTPGAAIEPLERTHRQARGSQANWPGVKPSNCASCVHPGAAGQFARYPLICRFSGLYKTTEACGPG